jgi:2-haloacid dehalogenase
MKELESIKALTFDVFGTVVDWRSGIIREGRAVGRAKKIDADWARFADLWRGLYQPAMSRVRSGEMPWTKLDQLHRMSLEQVLEKLGIFGLNEREMDELNRAWHRLEPWPDVVPGLTRMKRKFILASLSNGNVALLVDIAKHAGLPWDAVLGAEVARHYKPQPEAYLRTADFLGLSPQQCMMVAAHNGDLVAAESCGFRTAFVLRPSEHGPGQTTDLAPERDYDVIANDFFELADKLGC